MSNITDPSSYHHKTRIQVRFKDIDKQGHVNNAVHLTYFEIARIAYFEDAFRKENSRVKTGIILAKSEINYKRPILLNDNLYCYTRISRFGTKSFDMEHLLVHESETGHAVCAYGTCVIVCIDYDTMQTIEVPKEMIISVNAFEKIAG